MLTFCLCLVLNAHPDFWLSEAAFDQVHRLEQRREGIVHTKRGLVQLRERMEWTNQQGQNSEGYKSLIENHVRTIEADTRFLEKARTEQRCHALFSPEYYEKQRDIRSGKSRRYR